MTASSKIRVLLVDDHAIARSGVAALLATHEDIEVAGEATDGMAAVQQYKTLQPDVLVTDLRMAGFDGLSAIARVRDVDADARILVLSHYDRQEDVFKAIEAGARGYLTKDAAGDELADAIRAVMKGRRYLPPAISETLAERLGQVPLTPREQQVLEAMFRGGTNKQIAEQLKIAERTVVLHVGNVLSKLGSKTRTEAIAEGLARGLLQSPDGR